MSAWKPAYGPFKAAEIMAEASAWANRKRRAMPVKDDGTDVASLIREKLSADEKAELRRLLAAEKSRQASAAAAARLAATDAPAPSTAPAVAPPEFFVTQAGGVMARSGPDTPWLGIPSFVHAELLAARRARADAQAALDRAAHERDTARRDLDITLTARDLARRDRDAATVAFNDVAAERDRLRAASAARTDVADSAVLDAARSARDAALRERDQSLAALRAEQADHSVTLSQRDAARAEAERLRETLRETLRERDVADAALRSAAPRGPLVGTRFALPNPDSLPLGTRFLETLTDGTPVRAWRSAAVHGAVLPRVEWVCEGRFVDEAARADEAIERTKGAAMASEAPRIITYQDGERGPAYDSAPVGSVAIKLDADGRMLSASRIVRSDARLGWEFTRIERVGDARKEATTMAKNEATTAPGTPTLTAVLATDATDAAWRTAGSQFVRLARDPLAAVLARHLGPGDDALRGRVAAFLQTELGEALVTAALAAGLTAMPAGVGGEVPARLARELRVRSMAGAGDLLAEVLMGPLREVMAMYLRDVQPAVAAIAPPALEDGAQRVPSIDEARARAAAEKGG